MFSTCSSDVSGVKSKGLRKTFPTGLAALELA